MTYEILCACGYEPHYPHRPHPPPQLPSTPPPPSPLTCKHAQTQKWHNKPHRSDPFLAPVTLEDRSRCLPRVSRPLPFAAVIDLLAALHDCAFLPHPIFSSHTQTHTCTHSTRSFSSPSPPFVFTALFFFPLVAVVVVFFQFRLPARFFVVELLGGVSFFTLAFVTMIGSELVTKNLFACFLLLPFFFIFFSCDNFRLYSSWRRGRSGWVAGDWCRRLVGACAGAGDAGCEFESRRCIILRISLPGRLSHTYTSTNLPLATHRLLPLPLPRCPVHAHTRLHAFFSLFSPPSLSALNFT